MIFLFRMKKLIFLFILSMFLIGCDTQNQKIIINDKTFYVEIADDPIERAQGLMFREKLEENSGMLFIFDSSERHSFWMKNTIISLDIIWIDENLKVVYVFDNAQPCMNECNSIMPDRDARYVLEINSGLAEKYNFKIGDRVSIY